MKTSLALSFLLVAALTALAQNSEIKSPAGEVPLNVRNGRAQMAGHFGNPAQMLRLTFGLVTPHPAEEEQFLADLMKPGSPQFHKFLTPDQWTVRFGPSVAAERAVVEWATSQGLTITQRYANRLTVQAEAPMATVEKALQVRINNYQLEGNAYFSNEREPVLPAAVRSVVRSVEGLNNFTVMHPSFSRGPVRPGPIYTPGSVASKPVNQSHDGDRAKYEKAQAASLANPQMPSITNNAYDPTDIFAANGYDYAALSNQGHCCNPNHVGSGPGGAVGSGSPPQSSIAVAAFGHLHYTGSLPIVNLTDIAGFQAQYNYLAYNVTFIDIDGTPSVCVVTATQPCNGDVETALDTEWTTATANSFGAFQDTAQVYVYQGNGAASDVYQQMLSDGYARIFTTSFYGGTEAQYGGDATSGNIGTVHSIFNNMVGTGWTLLSAAGDQGSTGDCATTSVEYPYSDPDIVTIGGTSLFSGGAGGTFSSESGWTGGTSAGSCKNNGGGGSGGCSAVFGLPDYQGGSNGSCGGQHSIPAISLNASVGENMYFNGSLFGVGGTSISSPMMAGFFAQEGAYLVYEANVTGNSCGAHPVSGEPCEPVSGGYPGGAGMGNGNTYVYFFGNNPTYAPHYPFYDITSGCNSNDITAASPFPTFYCATSGYDLVTGWGTSNMLQLSWAINTFIAGDFGAPSVAFSGETPGHWYNTPPTVQWSITDTSANGAVPNGVAGYSWAWDADPGDVFLGDRTSTNNSYFTGPANPNATTGSQTLTTQGCHTANVRSWDNGGTSGNSTFEACYDSIPPVVNCGTPDTLWHANNVFIACTASDNGSGLAIPSQASINLTTNVAANTETATAFTNSVSVCDVAGNCTPAGPVGPIMVDRTPPVITIGSPTASIQYLQQGDILVLNYGVTDTGSGVNTVAATMDGSPTIAGNPIVNGMSVNLATFSLGAHTLLINATDNVGNASSLAVTFNVVVLSSNNCNGVYTGVDPGNLTVSTGQNCTFTHGSVSGNVTLNGGTLTLENGSSVGTNLQQNGGNLIVDSPATIGGNLLIGGGTFSLLGPAITVTGNLQVQNLPAGSFVNQVCGTSVGKNLQVQSNGAPVEIGGGVPPCAGNTVSGDLQVQNNTAAMQIYSAGVSGNLQVQSNTSSVAVFSNNVGKNLQCSGNNAGLLTGGLNTPGGQKQGQCSAF